MSTARIQNPDELLPTRRSLLERLRNLDDQNSWREFFETYWKVIYGAAIRAGLSDQEAEDAVQETVIGVARKMETFVYDPAICSFKGWLMHVTRRRIIDQFRRRKKQLAVACPLPDGTNPDELEIEQPEALTAIWEEEWQMNVMDLAMQRLRRTTKSAQYQIFHLHVVKGLEARDVAKLTGASLTNIYVTCHRLTNQVKAEVRRLEKTVPHA